MKANKQVSFWTDLPGWVKYPPVFILMIGIIFLIFILNSKNHINPSAQATSETLAGTLGIAVGALSVYMTFIAFWIQYKANEIQYNRNQKLDQARSVEWFRNRIKWYFQSIEYGVANLNKFNSEFSESLIESVGDYYSRVIPSSYLIELDTVNAKTNKIIAPLHLLLLIYGRESIKNFQIDKDDSILDNELDKYLNLGPKISPILMNCYLIFRDLCIYEKTAKIYLNNRLFVISTISCYLPYSFHNLIIDYIKYIINDIEVADFILRESLFSFENINGIILE